MTTFNIKSATFPQFTSALDKNGYIPVDLDALYAAYSTLQQMAGSGDDGEDAVPTIILDGPPGAGKSYMAKAIAKTLGAAYLQYSCHPDTSHEEVIRDINIEAPVVAQSGFAEKKYTKDDIYIYGPLYDAVRQSQKGPVVLLIDEIDKARTAIDALLLGFLNDGYLSVQGLGEDNGVERLFAKLENIIVVITKNDERDLHPALLRRGRVVYMDYPEPMVETRILTERAGIGHEAARSLVTQANKLRRNSNISKPPSPPELVRLAEDFKTLVERNVRTESDGNGGSRLVCDVPREVLNNSFINSMLAKKEEHALGKNLLKDKSFGTALLSAMLRDKGTPQQRIHYLDVDVLRRGPSSE